MYTDFIYFIDIMNYKSTVVFRTLGVPKSKGVHQYVSQYMWQKKWICQLSFTVYTHLHSIAEF